MRGKRRGTFESKDALSVGSTSPAERLLDPLEKVIEGAKRE